MSLETSLNFRQVAPSITTSGTVVAEDLATLRDGGVEVVVDLVPATSEYAVAGEGDIVTGQGLTYIHIPVDFAAPSHEDIAAFIAAMDANAGRRIHVHCAANYRVSAFYGVYAMAKGWWTEAEADEHLRGVWDPATYPGWEPFIAAERARLQG